MQIRDVISGTKLSVKISPVSVADYERLSKRRYFFDWPAEKKYKVFKLSLKNSDDILGLVSVHYFAVEQRIAIRLLAVASEQVGTAKTLDGIAGVLLAYVARLAIKEYGADAAISLVPKTQLRSHYMSKYGFEQAGMSLFIAGRALFDLIEKYEDHDR